MCGFQIEMLGFVSKNLNERKHVGNPACSEPLQAVPQYSVAAPQDPGLRRDLHPPSSHAAASGALLQGS